MAVRIGVDVGGTFTKAVACDVATLAVVARAVVPTTHDHPDGVGAGVADAIERVAGEVVSAGLGPISSVAHSTTQAVNALLEGDTARVGVLALGRRPDLGRIRKRTAIGTITLAPGHPLETVSTVVDVTDGVDLDAIEAAIRSAAATPAPRCWPSARHSGSTIRRWRSRPSTVAERVGLPACAGHELTGLYGLEMRTVTAALNAGILPRALATASVVDASVARVAPDASLLVMRGDGGAADLRTMRRHPILTAFSGPAASVAGALRHTGILDGVVIEVGGTSTNVSVVKGGRPILAYVRVLDHLTSRAQPGRARRRHRWREASSASSVIGVGRASRTSVHARRTSLDCRTRPSAMRPRSRAPWRGWLLHVRAIPSSTRSSRRPAERATPSP